MSFVWNVTMATGQYEKFTTDGNRVIGHLAEGGSLVVLASHLVDESAARVVAGILRNAQQALDAAKSSVEAYTPPEEGE